MKNNQTSVISYVKSGKIYEVLFLNSFFIFLSFGILFGVKNLSYLSLIKLFNSSLDFKESVFEIERNKIRSNITNEYYFKFFDHILYPSIIISTLNNHFNFVSDRFIKKYTDKMLNKVKDKQIKNKPE